MKCVGIDTKNNQTNSNPLPNPNTVTPYWMKDRKIWGSRNSFVTLDLASRMYPTHVEASVDHRVAAVPYMMWVLI